MSFFIKIVLTIQVALIYIEIMENSLRSLTWGWGWPMTNISREIESLRRQLLETVDRCSGNFLHPQVLLISQELDLLIVSFQQLQKKKSGPKTHPAICDASRSEASIP